MSSLSPLRQLLFCVLFVLTAEHVSAQVDSFFIEDISFKVRIPEKWQFVSMSSGLCRDDKSNLTVDMPMKCNQCFGRMKVTVSEITPEERIERAKDDEDTDPLKIDNSSYTKETGDFVIGGGYYESRVDNDTFLYTSASGQFVIKKAPVTPKQNKRLKLTPIHYYSRWYYFPINDTLEIIITFNGMISHDDESPVDVALSDFTNSFFTDNKDAIEALDDLTNPYLNEPLKWPLDSMAFWKTQLKYPLVNGWQYDSSAVAAGKQTRHLQLNLVKQDSCDEGKITVTSVSEPIDPKKNIDKKYVRFLGDISGDLAESYVQRVTDTTGFSKQKQHYYFNAKNSTEERSDCNKPTRYFDTVNVYIHLSPYERINITVTFAMSSADDRLRSKYYHDFSRFLTEMLEANDFEQIYQLNKPVQPADMEQKEEEVPAENPK